MRVSAGRPEGQIQSLDLHGVSVSRLRGGAGELARTPQLIDAQPRSSVLLSVALEGTVSIRAGRSATEAQSVICLSDKPYTIASAGPVDVVTIRVPLSCIHVRAGSLEDRHALPLDDQQVRRIDMLRSFIVSAIHCAPAGPAECRVLSTVAIDLLSLVVRASASPDARVPADERFELATSVMRQRSADPGLTLAAVARACRVSRRELELAFAAHASTPAAYLRRTRVENALRLLEDTTAQPSVSTIAHEVGFADVTTFIRAFRRAYATTPNAWRRQYKQVAVRR